MISSSGDDVFYCFIISQKDETVRFLREIYNFYFSRIINFVLRISIYYLLILLLFLTTDMDRAFSKISVGKIRKRHRLNQRFAHDDNKTTTQQHGKSSILSHSFVNWYSLVWGREFDCFTQLELRGFVGLSS